MMPECSSHYKYSPDQAGYACAYPSCTITVGRARLLYDLLHSTGMDKANEIKAMW